MAKAKHPKLKWAKDLWGFWRADPDGQRYEVEKVEHRWEVTSEAGFLGEHPRLDGAKAIAQAFADAETLRGEGK